MKSIMKMAPLITVFSFLKNDDKKNALHWKKPSKRELKVNLYVSEKQCHF